MFPLKIVAIGCNDTEMAALRCGLTNLAATLDFEFADSEKAIQHCPSLADCPCLFLSKLNGPEDLNGLARLNRAFRGKPIVGLMNSDCDLNAVLAALRAGAAQMVLFPLCGEDFQAALETVTRQFGCAAQESKVIAISSVNEGCGATSLAINLSEAMATHHKKSCVLVELSLRLGRLASYLEIDPPFTTHDLLAGDNLDITMVKQALTRVKDNFQALTGPFRSLDHQAASPARIIRLIQCLRQLCDVLVIDLPCTLDDVYFECLAAAHQVVLVAEQSVPSFHALKLISEALTTKAAGVKQHVVINRFDARELEFEVSRVKEFLQAAEIRTVPNDPRSFKRALNSGRPLLEQSPTCRASLAIASLAGGILGTETLEPPRHSFRWLGSLARLFRPKSSARHSLSLNGISSQTLRR